MHACIYLCAMHVCVYICMNACEYACMHMDVINIWMHACM